MIRFFIAITALFSGTMLAAQTGNDFTAKIDSVLQAAAVRPFSGVVMITQQGKTKYLKAYGYADFIRKTPLKTDDQFVLLSNSKQITAVLVLQEYEKGHLQLQDAIRKYLPGIQQSWADTVTIHQLLNHTSGIAGLDMPLSFVPGTQFRYSDLNYMLLGKIVAHAAGKSYRVLVNELFSKCGMKHSYFPDAKNTGMLVHGMHYNSKGEKQEVSAMIIPEDRIPAAGIVSTVYDMSTWNELLYNGKLLKPAAFQLMRSYSIKATHPVFGDKEIGYGYGIRVNDQSLPVEYGHTGIVPDQGFTSLLLYYPATRTSIVVLENQAFENMQISYAIEIAIKKIVLQSRTLHVQ